MNTEDLSQQVAMLTAIEEIKNLKATYCSYCDTNYDPNGLSSLFVENGIWDGGPEFGRHVGKRAIHDFFLGASGSIIFAAHLVMNPIIKVNGESADGKWRLLMPCTVNNEEGTPESRWLLSAYTEQYVKAGAEWLFKSLIVDSQFYAAHLDGWVNETT
jgi:hypothetical protein